MDPINPIAIFYNPFRTLGNRYRQYHFDGNDGRLNQQRLPLPSAKTSVRADTPRIYGQLFSSTETQDGVPATHQSAAVNPSTEEPVAQNDEEKSSIPQAEAASGRKPPLRCLNLLQWKSIVFGKPLQNTETSEWIQDHRNEDPIPIRTRKVVVAEYGNTDKVTEGCASVSSASAV